MSYRIVKKELVAPDIYWMEIVATRLAQATKPGQFLIIIPTQDGERIPLTVVDQNTVTGTVTIVFQVVGKSTRYMAQCAVGDSFYAVVGPLGKPSEFIHLDLPTLRNKHFLFIAGGVGTAPVYPQVKWLKERGIGVDVIVGARSKELLFMVDEMRHVAQECYISTDDGSEGFKGRVPELIRHLIDNEHKHYDEVIAIGPMIMMKFVSQCTKDYGIKTTVSLNTLMVDGTGMCGACRVSVDGKMRFACVEGPEFDGHLVDYDEAMRRQTQYRSFEIATETPTHQCKLASAVSTVIPSLPENTKQRVPVREQAPDVRITNFEEVSYGYNQAEAQQEAQRCLQCKKPRCVAKCPVNVDIPAFINKVKQGQLLEANRIIMQDNALPAVCGRVCPQESQCEGDCIVGKKGGAVAIGKLERFVADWAREQHLTTNIKSTPAKSQKIAIIGSGPAGLACAGDLIKAGYSVTVFEALHKAGGVLVYGIPEFRLPKAIVAHEIDLLQQQGVQFEMNTLIGQTVTIDDLLDKEGYNAVFIGSGAGLPKFMGIPGETLNGVFSANELLTRSNLMKAYLPNSQTPVFVGKRLAVVGGGNVAMDAARTAKRLGAETYCVYRRTELEMPARREEIHHAHEEGIIFHELTNPVAILGNAQGWVEGMRCVRMELGAPDASGRRSPIEIPNSEFTLALDAVVMSLGTAPNPLITETTHGLETNRWHGLVADEHTGQTTRKGLFAGGDAVTGAATVILAMGAGRKAAKAIDLYLVGQS